jgi:hypothetical protein
LANLRIRASGVEPKRTLSMTARPSKRTRQETTRRSRRGSRRRVTRGQGADAEATGKSPKEMSTLPRGTEGVPSCVAASARNRKLPASSQAARCPPATPGPTEPNHPRASGMHRAGPQLPRKVGWVPAAEPAASSVDPNTPSAISTATLATTPNSTLAVRLRVPRDVPNLSEAIPARWHTRVSAREQAPYAGPWVASGSQASEIRRAVSHHLRALLRRAPPAGFD